MNKSENDNEEPKLSNRAKLAQAKLVSTSILNVKKSENKNLDLRSPDDFKQWREDPDDLRTKKRTSRKASTKQSD